MKIGTKTAVITVTYERESTNKPEILAPLPSPNSPLAVSNDGYEVLKPLVRK